MDEYVKINITGSEKNQQKGFYLLLTKGDTFSAKKDEYIIEKSLMNVLTKNNIHFDVLD